MLHTKRNFKSKNKSMPTVKDVMAARQMSLKDAYKVALEYNERPNSSQNKAMYKRALELITRHNPEVAKRIQELYGDDFSFKKFSIEEFEQLFAQISAYLDAKTKAEIKKDVLGDAEVRQAVNNTTFTDNHGNPLSQDDSEVVRNCTYEVAYASTLVQTSHRREQIDVSSFARKVKKSFLAHLASVRAEVSLQADKVSDSIKDAFDFKKPVHVSFNTFNNWFENKKKSIIERKDRFVKSFKDSKVEWKARANKYGTMLMATVLLATTALSSCNNKQSKEDTRTDVAKELHINPATTSVVKSDTLTLKEAVAVVDTVQAKTVAAADTLKAPQEWNDSLGVTKGGFKVVRDFCNKTFKNVAEEADFKGENAGFEYAFNKASTIEFDSLDVNPMQTLRAYVYVRSMYPNPDVKGLAQEHADAARAAIALEEFINCDNQINEDMSHLFIDQVAGTLNIRATHVDDPCGGHKVVYTSTQGRQNKKTGEDAPVDVISDEAPVDTTKASRLSSEVSFEVDTIAGRQDSIPGVEIKKGNTLNDGKTVKTVSADEITGLGVKDATVLASLQAGSDTINITAPSVADSSQISIALRNDIAGLDSVLNAPSVIASTPIDSLKQNLSATAENVVVTTPQSTKAHTLNADQDSIVVGTDGVELGTPSAGNHERRGGVDGSGLTAKQQQYMVDKLGQETVDAMRESIPTWFTDRGAPGEGYSNDEVIYCAAVMAATAPNTPETRAIFDYTIGCHQGETLPTGLAGRIKRVMDGIHQNKTRDDMDYTQGVIVDRVDYNGCDKKQTVHQRAAAGGHVTASGSYFDRMFRISVPARTFLSQDVSFAVEERVDTATVDLTAQKLKGNTLNDGKVVRDLSVADVLNLSTSDQTVMYSGQMPADAALILQGNTLDDGRIVDQTSAQKLASLKIKSKKACYRRKAEAKKQLAKVKKQNAQAVNLEAIVNQL